MVDCANPGCRKELPISTLIGTTIRQLTRAVSSDCNQNIVYLTDDPGVISTSPEDFPAWDIATTYASGEVVESGGVAYQSIQNNNVGNDPAATPLFWKSTYLTTTNRFQVVGSNTQASTHWPVCTAGIYNSTYSDLNQFFQLGAGTARSPGFVIAVYWDRVGGETIAEALDALYKCFRCFEIIAHTTYLSDDTPFYDNAFIKDIEAWAVANDEKVPVNGTLDAAMKVTFTETTSEGAQASALDYRYSHYVWLGEVCVDEIDGNCDPTGNKIVRASATHLKYAAIAASYSTSGATYIPDPFFRGPDGIPGELTAELTPTETINVTGTDRKQGGQLAQATRYANVYHSVVGRKGFLYGTGITGYFTYDLLQVKYIKRDLENALLDKLHRTNNRGISDAQLAVFETEIISRITTYELQGIITTNEQDFDDRVPDGYLTVAQGDGWILAREQVGALSAAELSQGFSPSYFFCYVNLRQLRFLDLTICALLKPEQVGEVLS